MGEFLTNRPQQPKIKEYEEKIRDKLHNIKIIIIKSRS